MEALQQRVVQIAGDAQALIDSALEIRVEFPRDLIQTIPVQPPQQYEKGRHARNAEPDSLIVRRVDKEIQKIAGLIPHAAVIAGHDAETVVAWRKIVIERLPLIACVLPFGIMAFQLDAKTYLLRSDEAESGVVDFEIASQRGQAQVGRCVIGPAVGCDLLDVHRRGES